MKPSGEIPSMAPNPLLQMIFVALVICLLLFGLMIGVDGIKTTSLHDF
jgi:hypothetical protein